MATQLSHKPGRHGVHCLDLHDDIFMTIVELCDVKIAFATATVFKAKVVGAEAEMLVERKAEIFIRLVDVGGAIGGDEDFGLELIKIGEIS